MSNVLVITTSLRGKSNSDLFAERLIALCKKCGTTPILYATWAKKDEPENAALISGIYRTLAERYGALLAPIAELYAQLGAEHPEIDLYWHDGSHASPKGDDLIAATLAAIVCRPPARTADARERAALIFRASLGTISASVPMICAISSRLARIPCPASRQIPTYGLSNRNIALYSFSRIRASFSGRSRSVTSRTSSGQTFRKSTKSFVI